MKLECGNCGAIYPGDLSKQWGRTKETNGFGTAPRCVALVENPNAPRALNSQGEYEVPREVCGGPLGAISDDDAEMRGEEAIVSLTPNDGRNGL